MVSNPKVMLWLAILVVALPAAVVETAVLDCASSSSSPAKIVTPGEYSAYQCVKAISVQSDNVTLRLTGSSIPSLTTFGSNIHVSVNDTTFSSAAQAILLGCSMASVSASNNVTLELFSVSFDNTVVEDAIVVSCVTTEQLRITAYTSNFFVTSHALEVQETVTLRHGIFAFYESTIIVNNIQNGSFAIDIKVPGFGMSSSDVQLILVRTNISITAESALNVVVGAMGVHLLSNAVVMRFSLFMSYCWIRVVTPVTLCPGLYVTCDRDPNTFAIMNDTSVVMDHVDYYGSCSAYATLFRVYSVDMYDGVVAVSNSNVKVAGRTEDVGDYPPTYRSAAVVVFNQKTLHGLNISLDGVTTSVILVAGLVQPSGGGRPKSSIGCHTVVVCNATNVTVTMFNIVQDCTLTPGYMTSPLFGAIGIFIFVVDMTELNVLRSTSIVVNNATLLSSLQTTVTSAIALLSVALMNIGSPQYSCYVSINDTQLVVRKSEITTFSVANIPVISFLSLVSDPRIAAASTDTVTLCRNSQLRSLLTNPSHTLVMVGIFGTSRATNAVFILESVALPVMSFALITCILLLPGSDCIMTNVSLIMRNIDSLSISGLIGSNNYTNPFGLVSPILKLTQSRIIVEHCTVTRNSFLLAFAAVHSGVLLPANMQLGQNSVLSLIGPNRFIGFSHVLDPKYLEWETSDVVQVSCLATWGSRRMTSRDVVKDDQQQQYRDLVVETTSECNGQKFVPFYSATPTFFCGAAMAASDITPASPVNVGALPQTVTVAVRLPQPTPSGELATWTVTTSCGAVSRVVVEQRWRDSGFASFVVVSVSFTSRNVNRTLLSASVSVSLHISGVVYGCDLSSSYISAYVTVSFSLASTTTFAIQATKTISGFASLFGGAVLGFGLSRSRLLFQLENCAFDDTVPLSWVDNPLGMSIGLLPQKIYLRGAVIGNSILCYGLSLLLVAVAALIIGCKQRTKGASGAAGGASSGDYALFTSAVKAVNMPGLSTVFFATWMQSTVGSSVALVTSVNDGGSLQGGDVVLCILGIAALMAPLLHFAFVFRSFDCVPLPIGSPERPSLYPQGAGNILPWAKQWLGWMFHEDVRWASGSRGELFLFTYGAVFEPYRRYYYFMLIEFTWALMQGILAGLRPETDAGCAILLWLLLAINVVVLLTYVLLSPQVTRVDRTFAIVGAVLQVAATVLVILSMDWIVESLIMTQVYASFVLIGVQWIWFFKRRLKYWLESVFGFTVAPVTASSLKFSSKVALPRSISSAGGTQHHRSLRKGQVKELERLINMICNKTKCTENED